jgi:DNA-binding beta-propeller fold protein YncE
MLIVPALLLAGLPSCLPGHRAVTVPPAPLLHAPAAGAFSLSQVGDVALPGPAVRFEAMSLDTGTDRLFLAHMDANQLVVVDVRGRTVVGTIDGVGRVAGVWASPELERVYAGATAHGEIVVVDARTLAVWARAGGVGYPVAVTYAPNPRRLVVVDGEGSGVVIVDVFTNQVVTRIPLGGTVAGATYDPVSACVLVTVGAELVVVDPETDSIAARIALPGIIGAHGVAVDAGRRLAFVSGQANARVAVVDLTAGRLTSTVSVFSELAGDPITLVHEGDVILPHAHTLLADPRTHLLYVPLEDGPRLRITAPRPPG